MLVSHMVALVSFHCRAARADEPGEADIKTSDTAAANPVHPATAGALIGGNCTYATSMMARRVMAEGQDFRVSARFVTTDNKNTNQVACPYRLDDLGDVYVIANEVVEHLFDGGDSASDLNLAGRILTEDGKRYFVITSYTVNES